SVACYSGLSDIQLATLYAQCHYVSGLRRIEGFELPAAEGLLCGARPILFDRDHYRNWYGSLAEYITESDRPGVVAQLVDLFGRQVRTVTADERNEAVRRFHWPTILNGFWERCLALAHSTRSCRSSRSTPQAWITRPDGCRSRFPTWDGDTWRSCSRISSFGSG